MSVQTAQTIFNRAFGGNGNCAVDGSDFGTDACTASAAFVSNSKSVLSIVLPTLIGLLIGIWLGKTQLRQQKSFASILSSWFSSIFLISKFWIKFHMDSKSGSDGKKKPDVLVQSINGTELKKNYVDTVKESGCDPSCVPKHVAIIMDGNRRYGRRMYGKGSLGHFDGGLKGIQVIEWLDTEGVKDVTLYAFSTENWNRESSEVDTLMGLFLQFIENDLRPIVFNRKLVVRHICTDSSRLPHNLVKAINGLVAESNLHKTPQSLTVNVCLSYGSRGEMLLACQSIARECVAGTLKVDQLTEDSISERLQTSNSPDPDVLVRTSGEERISNFLLWQLAYTELFFLEKDWPELEKEDFLKIIRSFAKGRQRRFGK